VAQQDVDAVREAFAAFQREGVDALLARIHPEFEIEVSPELSAEPDTYRGADGLRRYFAGFEGVMEDVRFEPEEFIDAGQGNVVATGRVSARSAAAGLPVEQWNAQLWTVRNGKLLRARAYATEEAALAAAGVSSR
jgi:ketosteroid isomerase-like protein